jgi:hypothetical protein
LIEMTNCSLPPQASDFARKGDAIYKRHVRPKLSPHDDGRFVAIDIDSEAYTIDADALTALRKLRCDHPDARPFLVRVGARAAFHFGRALPAEHA